MNAFISIFRDRALKKTDEIDNKLNSTRAGKLAGLAIAIKDNINVKNETTTCASKILSNYVSPYDATVIKKLEAEDAIIIGKTNMDEFGMGSTNENSYFQHVKNPFDLTRVPGGSSGGSAVAIAATMTPAALGSDTGGSIRLPAAFCGVVGLKPTYGSVSRFGLVAFASSLDQIGPMTKSVRDCIKIFEVIAGYDRNDSTSVSKSGLIEFNADKQNIEGLKIGIPTEYFSDGLDTEIKDKILQTVEQLEKLGAAIIPISLPHTAYSIASYYIIANAEASSNLSRFDGAHYGYRNKEARHLQEMYIKSRTEGFGEEVKRRILLGTFVLSAGYYDAYYERAQRARTLIKKDFEHAFKQCHCIIAPITPTTAFKLGEKTNNPLAMYLSDIYTVSANLAGIPAMSVPCGFDSNGLPIGLQLMANRFDEATIFNVALGVEKYCSH